MKNINSNSISLNEVQSMIQSYHDIHGNDQDFLASEYFDLESLNFILTHPRCKGIRIFNAIKNSEGTMQNRLILVGIDENGKTLLKSGNQLAGISAAGLGLVVGFAGSLIAAAEHGQPCPPDCLNVPKLL